MSKLKKIIHSFESAWRGVATVFHSERNFRLQILAALVVVVAGFFFQLKIWEWLILIFLILLVLLLEMLNTVFERLVDMLKPRIHLFVYDIKNITAGMVLITAISAIIIGVMIFGSRFF